MARWTASTANQQRAAQAALDRSLKAWQKNVAGYYKHMTGDAYGLVGPPTRAAMNRQGSARTPVGQALLGAGGELKRSVQKVVPKFGGRGTWPPPKYPVWWRWLYVYRGTASHKLMLPGGRMGTSKPGSRVIFYPGTTRPHGRIHRNVLTKMSRRSNADKKTVAVYVRFARFRGRWDQRNAWYAKFVEHGTLDMKGKRGYLTKGHRFFSKGVQSGRAAAQATLQRKLREGISKFRPGPHRRARRTP